MSEKATKKKGRKGISLEGPNFLALKDEGKS